MIIADGSLSQTKRLWKRDDGGTSKSMVSSFLTHDMGEKRHDNFGQEPSGPSIQVSITACNAIAVHPEGLRRRARPFRAFQGRQGAKERATAWAYVKD